MTDEYGNHWESARFNGHVVDTMSLSLAMFLAGYPLANVRDQQSREVPIGGWQDAYRRLVDDLQSSCPAGYRVGYAPFDVAGRHQLTFLPLPAGE